MMSDRPVPALSEVGRRPRRRARLPRAASLAAITAAALALATGAARAQSVGFDLGGGGSVTSHVVQLTALMTALSFGPGLLVACTAFTRIIIVLSLLRSALGAQGTPPNPVLIGLALFLTFFVMEPTFDQAWTQGGLPLSEGRIGTLDGLTRVAAPFHSFMASRVRPGDLGLFLNMAHVHPAGADATPWRVLAPAFMVGELRRAFEMGFLIYLPFLVIDLIVSSILMSLGMMMLPPSAVSLPFKLIFFVLIDGWHLIAGSLVQSFGG